MLPFFTFTFETSSCSPGPRSKTTLKVTGVDLLRGQHDPLTHKWPPGEYGDGQVVDAVPLGKNPAAIVIALALIGLLVTLVRNPIRGRLSVVVAVALVWALLVLAIRVGHPNISVSLEAGFWLALLFGLAAATACAVLLYATNSWSRVDLRPAGFWRRLAAWLLDAIGIGILSVPVAVLTTSAGGTTNGVFVEVIVIAIVYRVAFEVLTGSSPGGHLMGTRVLRADGTRIGIGHAIVRTVADPVCLVATLGAGDVLCGLTSGRRALHDGKPDDPGVLGRREAVSQQEVARRRRSRLPSRARRNDRRPRPSRRRGLRRTRRADLPARRRGRGRQLPGQ